jgi:hypothetical protein
VIPGLDQGPDALAVGTLSLQNNLFAFSPFSESEGGRINSIGQLVTYYGTSHGATGADFDAQNRLWLVCGTVTGAGAVLRRVSIADGSVQQTVAINQAITARMADVAFDPHTGACYVLAETNLIHEIDLVTGNVVSTTNVAPLLVSLNAIVGGMDFDDVGARLFLSTGAGAGADVVVVLQRDLAPTVCSNGPGQIPCPCGNAGLAGRGCENSFATGGGHLTSSGVPRVSDDTFTLQVAGLPPVTTALFFQGTVLAQEVFAFGDGVRCVSGTIIRLGTKGTSAGAASYPVGADQPVSVRGQVPVAGATRFYQVWCRNVAPFCTSDGFNLTTARKAVWAP